MKTIEKFKNEYLNSNLHIEDGEYTDTTISNAIYDTLEFAQRWVPVEEELPPPEESVLVKDCFGKHRVSVLMYDMKTWKTISLSDGRVTHWRLIDLK